MEVLANIIDAPQHKVTETDQGDNGSKVQFLIELPDEEQAVLVSQPQDEVKSSECEPVILS